MNLDECYHTTAEGDGGSEGTCELVHYGLFGSWNATGGSVTTDLLIVVGLFLVAGAIWFIQIGGDEGLNNTLFYISSRARALSELGR